MKKILDAISSLFVYRSPEPMSGERLKRFVLMGKSNRVLRELASTTSHLSKKKLVDMILSKER